MIIIPYEKNLRESGNQHSAHIISVPSIKSNQIMKIIVRMPNAMTKVGDGLISEWKDL